MQLAEPGSKRSGFASRRFILGREQVADRQAPIRSPAFGDAGASRRRWGDGRSRRRARRRAGARGRRSTARRVGRVRRARSPARSTVRSRRFRSGWPRPRRPTWPIALRRSGAHRRTVARPPARSRPCESTSRSIEASPDPPPAARRVSAVGRRRLARGDRGSIASHARTAAARGPGRSAWRRRRGRGGPASRRAAGSPAARR